MHMHTVFHCSMHEHIVLCVLNACRLCLVGMIDLASFPGPLFFLGGGGGEEGLVHTICACAKIPRNPGSSDSSVNCHVYCPCNECNLSVILLFISTVSLLLFAGLFLHENSSHRLLQSR